MPAIRRQGRRRTVPPPSHPTTPQQLFTNKIRFTYHFVALCSTSSASSCREKTQQPPEFYPRNHYIYRNKSRQMRFLSPAKASQSLSKRYQNQLRHIIYC